MMWAPLHSFDVHPPLYYLLLHGWMVLFGDGIMAARSLSLVFGVVTVALAMRFTRWLANERAALIAGWLMAIMPMAVRYSQEARMYALMGMLAIAAAMVLAKWLKTPDNRRYLALYALLMTLSFYTHYFTIFTLIAHWLVVRCRAAVKAYVTSSSRRGGWPMWRSGWPTFLAAGAVQSAGAYRRTAGRRRRRLDPQVSWGDLPAMYWRFLTSHDGSNYPTAILWLLPAMFIALCALLLKRRAMPGHSRYCCLAAF